MTRTLFISLGKVAFGEAIIARLFAKRLPPESFKCYFVVADESRIVLQHETQFPQVCLWEDQPVFNEIIVEDFVDRNRIDLIVLCDYLTFAYSASDYGLDLAYLQQLRRPILSFDCYEWASTDYTLDFLDRDKRLAIRFTDLDGALRPCPLNKPRPPVDHTVCYDFLGTISEPAIEFSVLAEEFGLDSDHPTVVSPVAAWERIQRGKSSNIQFVELIEDLIFAALESLERDVTWVRVGDCDRYSKEIRGAVTVINIPALSPAKFDSLISGADGFLTTNVSSTSLAKRVLSGRTAVVLWNSIDATSDADLKDLGFSIDNQLHSRLSDCYPVRPFSMYPLGWGKFLQAVLAGNLYLDVFEQVQILDLLGTKGAMDRMLNGSDAKQLAALQSYRRNLERLPSPEECIRHFL